MSSFNPRLPAEWEHQSGILLSWPTADSDWSENLAEAHSTYLELIKAICANSHAHVCCNDTETHQRVEYCLRTLAIERDSYTLYTIPYDDTWTRDYGPISLLKENETTWLSFKFNAWGNKFPHQQDKQLTRLLHKEIDLKRELENIDFILEGGSIDSDGNGTLLTTSQCLLDPARNAGLSKEKIEDRLKSTLGVHRILWINHGRIEGDDTNAHIDTLARFCSADTIAYVQCLNPDDPHFDSLSKMEGQLKSFSQANGERYNLIPLPLPSACFNKQGQRLPATYANFLINNGRVLAPVYGVETDTLALTQLQKCFPKYTIIPVQCRSLIEQYGSLHCITMQIA